MIFVSKREIRHRSSLCQGKTRAWQSKQKIELIQNNWNRGKRPQSRTGLNSEHSRDRWQGRSQGKENYYAENLRQGRCRFNRLDGNLAEGKPGWSNTNEGEWGFFLKLGELQALQGQTQGRSLVEKRAQKSLTQVWSRRGSQSLPPSQEEQSHLFSTEQHEAILVQLPFVHEGPARPSSGTW